MFYQNPLVTSECINSLKKNGRVLNETDATNATAGLEKGFKLLALKYTLPCIYYTRNGPAQARVMMKSVLSSAEHGRCPHKY